MPHEDSELVRENHENRNRIVSAISGCIIAFVFIAWIGSYLFLRHNALNAGQILSSPPGPTLLIAVGSDIEELVYKPLAWSESALSKRDVAVVNMDKLFTSP